VKGGSSRTVEYKVTVFVEISEMQVVQMREK